MKNKVIILLMYVSLAESVYFPTMNVDYGLDEKQVEVLHGIIINQEQAKTKYTEGVKLVFQIIIDLKIGIEIRYTKITEAFQKLSEALDVMLDSVILALGKSCSASVEIARKRERIELQDSFTRIRSALDLAQLGDYSKNKAKIEAEHIATQQIYKNIVNIYYNLINGCLNNTDIDIQVFIKNFRSKSLFSIVHTANALFNAIKVLAATTASDKREDQTPSTCEIEEFMNKAITSLTNSVQFKFIVLRTFYINFCLNESGIMNDIARSQYIASTTFSDYREASEIVLDVAISYLRRIDLGLDDDNDNDDLFSAINISIAKVIAIYDVGDYAILDFVIPKNPHDYFGNSITTVRKGIHKTNVNAVATIFNILHSSATRCANHSETLNYLKDLKRAVLVPIRDYIRFLVNLIRNKRTFSRELEAKLAAFEDIALRGVKIHILKFFDAAKILANAFRIGVVTQKDYSAIINFRDEANYGIDSCVQSITAAWLLVSRDRN